MNAIIGDYIHKKIEESYFIGAEIYVEKAGQILCHDAYGKASIRPCEKSLNKNQIFDLASVTKLFTSTLLLRLVEEGKCRLDDSVWHYIEGFNQISMEITLRHLLTHTSSLPAWYPLYAKPKQSGSVSEDIIDILKPLTIVPNKKVEYSDLNFILLGKIIENIEGKALDQTMKELLIEPLQMPNLTYNPPKSLWDRIVPTEWGNRIEEKMVSDRELYYNKWRQNVIHGQVNDGNAYYYLDGVSGHAGLFGNVEDLARLARVYLSENYLSRDMVLLSYKNHTASHTLGRGLGWVVDEANRGCLHTGFTGTSLFIVPEKELMIILLTSRLHQEQVRHIQPVRKELHKTIIQLCE